MASIIGPGRPICVDGRMLAAAATGVGRYADTLFETYRRAGASPLVLAADGPGGRLRHWAGAVGLAPRRALRNGPGDRLSASGELFRQAQTFFDLHRRPMPVATDGPAGVMHWTYPVPLRMKGWRNIYTVHDVIPLNQASLSPIDGDRHRRILQAIARSADRLITVSETSRDDIIGALGCAPDLVVSTPQGVAPLPADGPLPPGLSPGGFYLFCGSIEPRKNLERLVEAHAASATARPLVIAGPDGWRASEILSHIASRPGVIRLAYQTREGLGALMRDTRALLFPSLAEGFGLPVIEAMLAGAPVMTSDRAALRETAGGAALLVDPCDEAAMAAAITRLDQDEALAAGLIEAGRRRTAAFSLAAYAARLAVVHAELMEPSA